ncbi:MAG: CsgG/HfaB family protein, partial [Baekduia sp.]
MPPRRQMAPTARPTSIRPREAWPMRKPLAFLAVTTVLALATPAQAQQLGKGGTGVDETTELPRCAAPLGVVALVEEKTADPMDQLPPGMAALVRMAEAQNGGNGAKVDPLPLLKLMASRSGCFRVVDRDGAFDALQAERQIAGTSEAPRLFKADYLLSTQVVMNDPKAKQSGGGIGRAFGGAIGFKSKTLESQVLLSLVDVDTGIQEAVASGSARKRDLGVVGGGLLLGLGVGALGGGYTDTPIGKVTTLAMLDAFKKLMSDAQPRLAGRSATPAPSASVTASRP